MDKAGGDADAMLIGDSVWDVEAAGRAGIPTLGVLTGGYAEQELIDAGAAGRLHLGRRAPRAARRDPARRLSGAYAPARPRLELAQEALEEPAVALLVVEDRDHHVVRHRVDAVGRRR